MSKKNNLYLRQAGQALVMSEFLKRGYNVVLPQVDVGDDIFVLEDSKGDFHRIQVKTSSGIARKNGFTARFNLSTTQLETEFVPPLYYVFVSDFKMNWQPLIVISREDLFKIVVQKEIGSTYKNQILLYFSFSQNGGTTVCSNVSFSEYLNNWSDFPTILH